MSDQEEPPPPPPHDFFGTNGFDTGISLVDEDEYGEEPTRRVEMAPSFAPSFNPGPLTFDPMVATSASKTTMMPTPPAFSCPVLPNLNHPLEQTSVLVKHTDAAVILGRVEEQLKICEDEDDIEFETDRENSKIRGWTMDGVEFRIFFYNNDSSNNTTMVEIQRRTGRSWKFGRMVQKLLKAAENKQGDVEDDDIPPPPSSSSSSSVSLAFVTTLIGLNPRLALQTLHSMTCSQKMGVGTARAAVRQLLGDPDLGINVLRLAKTELDALRVLYNVAAIVASTSEETIPEQFVSMIVSTLEETKVEHSQRLVARIQKKLLLL